MSQPPGSHPADGQGPGDLFGGQPDWDVRRPRRDSYGVVGAGLATVGLVVVLISLLAVDWLEGIGRFTAVRDLVLSAPRAAGFSKVYFGWLIFVLGAAAFVLALLGNAPTSGSGGFRALGALAGIAGGGLAFLAIRLQSAVRYSEYLGHARAGFWLAVGGFAVIALGALIGPRRRW